MDDLDLDLEVDDFEADVDLDVEEVVLDDLVERGSDMCAVVVEVNCWWVDGRFVDGEAVDKATSTETAGRRTQHTTNAHAVTQCTEYSSDVQST